MDKRKLILFELNEVPWQVIDSFRAKKPHGALAMIIDRSKTFTTVCEDEITLNPWTAWPTLHRGVVDDLHAIKHLGQDLEEADRRYPSVWTILADAGVSVGVFGSLHTNQLPSNIGAYSFFVPDAFAGHNVVKPTCLAPLQEFNLFMTRKSTRNVDMGIPLKEAFRFLATYGRQGMSVGTAAMVASQVLTERFKPHLRCRRRSLQPAILFDVFMKLLRKDKPGFATFFSNHVAAAMHRYWAARFPSGDAVPEQWLKKFNGEIDNAMEIVDHIMRRLKTFVDANPEYKLIVATALGQAGVPFRDTAGFVSLSDVGRFMDRLGLPREAWFEKHVMAPCKSVIVDPEYAESLEQRLLSISINGKPMLKSEKGIAPLSFDRNDDVSFHFYFYMEDHDGPAVIRFGNELVSLNEIGFGHTPHQDGVACTARHSALGSLIVYDPAIPIACPGRPMISTLQVAPAILDSFDISPPPYMQRPDPTLLDPSVAVPRQIFAVASPQAQRQLERVD